MIFKFNEEKEVRKVQEGFKEILNRGKEYYEIRLDSIGGLGANLCGKMLGELGLKYLDVNSSSFSSYGSEKTGTPVKAFIRYCNKEKEIRLHAPITEPDLMVSFHEEFLEDATGNRYTVEAQLPFSIKAMSLFWYSRSVRLLINSRIAGNIPPL